MASAAFLALLAQPIVRWTLLAEIQVRQALHGWTSEGSGAYSCPCDLYTHPTTLRADRGLYRGLDAVWELTTPLTVRASLAAVQASGGYYHDGTTLYVKTSGGVNPDTVAMVQAVGTVRVATAPVTFTDQPPYDAQLDGSRLPSLLAQRPDLLRGILAYPLGDLTVTNADGFWDYLADPTPATGWQWLNNTVQIRLGGEDLAYSDYELITTMQVAAFPAAGNLTVTFQLRSQANALNRVVTRYTVQDRYGSGVSPNSSARLPYWHGHVRQAPLVFVYDNGLRNKWDAHFSGVFEQDGDVVAVEKATGTRTVLVGGGTDYLFTSGPSAAFDIDKTYDPDLYDIYADLAKPDTATAGAIALAILRDCGIPDAQIDLASFDALDADYPVRLGLWAGVRPGQDAVTGLVTGAELINLLERSGPLSVVNDGYLWRAALWDPSFDLATAALLTDADLRTCEPATEAPATSTGIKVQYRHAIYDDTWSETSSSSTEAQAAQQDSHTETVATAIVDLADAAVLAARLALIDRLPKLRFDIETGPVLFTARIGDKVRVQRPRGPASVGTFDLVMEIESLTKDLAALSVRARIGNMLGLGESVKRVAPPGTPAWASASADERRQYAFVADPTTQMVDPTDRTTYRQAVVW